MKSWFNEIYSLVLADVKEFFRIRFIITSSALMPVVMVLAFGLGARNGFNAIEGKDYFQYIFPAILAISAMFSSAYSAGFVIIFDREKYIVQDLIVSPVSYSSYILARIIASMIKSLPPLLIAMAIAIPLTSEPIIFNPLIVFVGFNLTTILFSTVGMIFGSFTVVYSFSGLVNIVLMPSMFFCDVFFPIANYQEFMYVVQIMPFTNAVQLFRYGISGEASMIGIPLNIMILLFYTVFTLGFWIWFFKKKMAH
jgi:ABC-2 type transport system permease protein